MTDWQYQEPGHDDETAELLRHGAAAFLREVLGLTDQPDHLAADLSPIKRDSNASIFTIQLESSVGPAAFLVYAYRMGVRGGDGHTGKELFDTGLETLQHAARNATPGPRAVAHAESDDFGYILATTPGTYRALTGNQEAEASPDATSVRQPEAPGTASDRTDTVRKLLKSLQTANAQATDWLAAVQPTVRPDGVAPIEETAIEFTEEETELALFLLDNDSIGNLLRALNLIVSTAQRQASNARHNDLDPLQDLDA